MATTLLTSTAAFRPEFLSSFGDFTDSTSWVTVRVTVVKSCIGSNRANNSIEAPTTADVEGGQSRVARSLLVGMVKHNESVSCSHEPSTGVRN